MDSSKCKLNHTSSENLKLQVDDIPGAKLQKPMEQCTVNILKRWLMCRGAKVTGKRQDLVNRVNNYINNGLDKNLVDPDGGVNLAKKRLELGLAEEVHPEVNENFPSTGFGTTDLPRISYRQIWKYLIEDVELKKQLSTEKPIVKGYNFYKSGHVLQIYSKTEHNKHYILSKVLPSMKKGKIYTVKIILQLNGDISNAFCCCPAGVDGRCNHLAATLFLLEDKTNINIAAVKRNNQTPQNIPCTSQPCTWNVPRKRKLEPQPVQSVKFQKHEYGRVTKHVAREYGDVRAPHQRITTSDDLKRFYTKVKEVEKTTNKIMGLSLILPHDLPSNPNNCHDVTKLQAISENPQPDEYLWKLVSPDKSCPLSLNEIAAKAERAKKRLFDSSKNRDTIESKTQDQHHSLLWYSVRKPRITASQTKRCLLKESTSP